MKITRFLPAAATLLAALAAPAFAQSIVSEPLGFNKIPCLPNSDTIVGVPFRPNGSQQGALAADAVDNGNDTATLSIAGSPGFAVNGFANTHYVKFSSGAKDGRIFAVSANTADSLTIDLNGETTIADPTSGALSGDTLVIARFWTLDSLFPPDQATTDPATTGHAIVKALNALNRRTDVMLPNLEDPGVNLPLNRKFFIIGTPAAWKEIATGYPDAGSVILWPDTYLVIRQLPTVTAATTYKISGEVEIGNMAIPLNTSATGKQDNFVAIPRPIDVALADLGLISSGAFVASTSPLSRADELFVYDNALALVNRSPSARYFYLSTDSKWHKVGPGSPIADADVVAAGAGIVIRKAQSDGSTAFWLNYPTYSNE